MLDKDKEYILWLCKRLVYKYKEDANILINIEQILDNNQTELSFYKTTHKKICEQIGGAINALNSIKQAYYDSLKATKNESFSKKIVSSNNLFENVDIQEMFG